MHIYYTYGQNQLPAGDYDLVCTLWISAELWIFPLTGSCYDQHDLHAFNLLLQQKGYSITQILLRLMSMTQTRTLTQLTDICYTTVCYILFNGKMVGEESIVFYLKEI